MHRFFLSVSVLLLTSLNLVEVLPVSKLEENLLLLRQRRQHQADLAPYQQHPSPSSNNQHLTGDLWNQIQPVFNDHLDSHLREPLKPGCHRTTNDKHIINKGDFVEYCVEKVLNQDGKSYSTKTHARLYKTDGTIIPLHQAESNLEVQTYNHFN